MGGLDVDYSNGGAMDGGDIYLATVGGAGMSKTAARRHQHNRHMRRRLRTPVWSWVERTDPAYLSDDDRAALRNRAARHSVPCSCYWCRSYRIEVSKFKQRKAMEAAA